jgi:NADP-dependent 3-hydroxy acid dehydrogenase YdfG
VKTNIFANSGAEQELSDGFFIDNPYLETQDIASAVIYALGAPAHVQVICISFLIYVYIII